MTDRPDNWIDPQVAKRLKEAQRAWGTQDALAAASGIAPGTLQKIIQGKTDPSLSSVEALCRVMNVRLDWIVHGKPEFSEVGSVIAGARQAMQQIEQDRALKDRVLVPYYPEVEASAGPGAIATDHVQEVTLAFRQDWVRKRGLSSRGLQAIHVRGDSMEPTLRSGDLIVFDTESTRHSDGLFVLNFDGELLVKRLQRLSQTRLVIASDNPLAGSSEIDLRDETQHPRIIGRVVWLGRDL